MATTTDTPQDFSAALKNAGLADFFSACTNAHRKEYLNWIVEAKKSETRRDRIAKAPKMLSEKQTEENAKTTKKA
jgi:uncharacterized protein YdeI (YjbR/CyaY-like superfamily)